MAALPARIIDTERAIYDMMPAARGRVLEEFDENHMVQGTAEARAVNTVEPTTRTPSETLPVRTVDIDRHDGWEDRHDGLSENIQTWTWKRGVNVNIHTKLAVHSRDELFTEGPVKRFYRQ